jgi:5,5'-dehydrodivanillate O-demethylase
MADHDARHASRLQLLTQTAAGTPMGTLLRQFWHPVAVGAKLAPGTARALRILSEDLTLYRGTSGTPYLVGGRCAHRCSVLHTGWVQGEQIRCMYHGWRFDGTGLCTEMPAERKLLADVRIPGYPVQEYGGLIFAYLGDGPAPAFDLPRKAEFERDDFDLSQHEEIWDCNWLQHSENSLDSTHLSFVHQWPTPTALGEQIGAAIPELSYEETSAGIRQTARRGDGNVRISNWTFPNNNYIMAAPPYPGGPWIHTGAWQVPVDDEHTLRITIHAYPGGAIGEQVRRSGGLLQGNAMDHMRTIFEEHRLPDAGTADVIMAQDFAAIRGQGVVHDRTRERLGASDAGIALLRRIIFRELDAIEAGAPAKAWKGIEGTLPMPTPVAR